MFFRSARVTARLLSESPIVRPPLDVYAAPQSVSLPGDMRRGMQEIVLSVKNQNFYLALGATVLLSSVTFPQNAKPGKLKMSVSPKQAYTFVDGKAIGPGNRVIKLDVDTDHVAVANYG